MSKRYDPSFKATLVLEVMKEEEALTEMAYRYEIHPNQITMWKKEEQQRNAEGGKKDDTLYRQIVQFKV